MKFSLKKISGAAPHSAFTDLCYWHGFLFCCFREASNHVSPDGRINILKLDSNGKVLAKARIIEQCTDLRDPKLTVHPNGKLCLLLWRNMYDSDGHLVNSKAASYFSSDGHSWSGARELGDSHWWLWRTRWHHVYHPAAEQWDSAAYGFAYNRGANAIHLYSGDPLKAMRLQKANVLSLEKHGLGYPNESDMIFTGNTAWAIVRRDADSYSAQLGHSKWPFNRWEWHDLEQYLGGPCMLKLEDGGIVVAARVWENQQLFTSLFRLNIETRSLRKLVDLPSAGDNSYPGLAAIENKLLLSYYSSHQDQKSQIYLATFDIADLL